MKNVVSLLLKATVTLALVACAGQSSDPLKDYKDVKAVPIHTKQSESQTFEVDKFSVEIVGANETTYGNFIEGKKGEVLVRVIPKIQAIENPSFDIINFPSANEPQISRVSKDTYKLVWTPSAGTIPQGLSQAEINFQLSVAANGQVENVKTLFLVSRTNKVPKIKGTDGLNVTAEEGQTVKFSVDVQDPNYNGAGTPELLISPYMNSNIEAFMANGSTYVTQNYSQKVNPVQLSQDTFRFYFEMKLNSLPDLLDRKGKIDPNAATVQLCFNLRALSVVQSASGTVQHCLEVKYSAQPATVAFASAERKVMAGQSNTIAMKISAANSSVAVKNAKNQIANLSGEKDMTCSDGATGSMDCQITWTPSCKATAKSAVLKLNVESTLNKKSKTTNVEETFEIDSTNCEALDKAKAEADKKAADEKAAAAKVEADKKAADALKAKEEKAAAAKKVQEEKAALKAEADKKAAEAKASAKVEADKKASESKAKAQAKAQESKSSSSKKSDTKNAGKKS